MSICPCRSHPVRAVGAGLWRIDWLVAGDYIASRRRVCLMTEVLKVDKWNAVDCAASPVAASVIIK